MDGTEKDQRKKLTDLLRRATINKRKVSVTKNQDNVTDMSVEKKSSSSIEEDDDDVNDFLGWSEDGKTSHFLSGRFSPIMCEKENFTENLQEYLFFHREEVQDFLTEDSSFKSLYLDKFEVVITKKKTEAKNNGNQADQRLSQNTETDRNNDILRALDLYSKKDLKTAVSVPQSKNYSSGSKYKYGRDSSALCDKSLPVSKKGNSYTNYFRSYKLKRSNSEDKCSTITPLKKMKSSVSLDSSTVDSSVTKSVSISPTNEFCMNEEKEKGNIIEESLHVVKWDQYCWECHKPVASSTEQWERILARRLKKKKNENHQIDDEDTENTDELSVILCEVCERSFHYDCLPDKEDVLKSKYICMFCLHQHSFDSHRSRNFQVSSEKDLHRLLLCTVDTMLKNKKSSPFIYPVSDATYPSYKAHIVKPMDLIKITKNITQGAYESEESFLSDVKWIVHNCIIFNKSYSPISLDAKRLLQICEKELEEAKICLDCHIHAQKLKKTGFLNVCRLPHILVWAKLKGYPFWPAKLMKVVGDEVLVRFFGAHDRAMVSVGNCFLYSKNSPVCHSKKKEDYDKSIEEMESHIKYLKKYFGVFQYAPFQTRLDPSRINRQRLFQLPKYNWKRFVRSRIVYQKRPIDKILEDCEELEPVFITNDHKVPSKKSVANKKSNVTNSVGDVKTDQKNENQKPDEAKLLKHEENPAEATCASVVSAGVNVKQKKQMDKEEADNGNSNARFLRSQTQSEISFDMSKSSIKNNVPLDNSEKSCELINAMLQQRSKPTSLPQKFSAIAETLDKKLSLIKGSNLLSEKVVADINTSVCDENNAINEINNFTTHGKNQAKSDFYHNISEKEVYEINTENSIKAAKPDNELSSCNEDNSDAFLRNLTEKLLGEPHNDKIINPTISTQNLSESNDLIETESTDMKPGGDLKNSKAAKIGNSDSLLSDCVQPESTGAKCGVGDTSNKSEAEETPCQDWLQSIDSAGPEANENNSGDCEFQKSLKFVQLRSEKTESDVLDVENSMTVTGNEVDVYTENKSSCEPTNGKFTRGLNSPDQITSKYLSSMDNTLSDYSSLKLPDLASSKLEKTVVCANREMKAVGIANQLDMQDSSSKQTDHEAAISEDLLIKAVGSISEIPGNKQNILCPGKPFELQNLFSQTVTEPVVSVDAVPKNIHSGSKEENREATLQNDLAQELQISKSNSYLESQNADAETNPIELKDLNIDTETVMTDELANTDVEILLTETKDANIDGKTVTPETEYTNTDAKTILAETEMDETDTEAIQPESLDSNTNIKPMLAKANNTNTDLETIALDTDDVETTKLDTVCVNPEVETKIPETEYANTDDVEVTPEIECANTDVEVTPETGYVNTKIKIKNSELTIPGTKDLKTGIETENQEIKDTDAHVKEMTPKTGTRNAVTRETGNVNTGVETVNSEIEHVNTNTEQVITQRQASIDHNIDSSGNIITELQNSTENYKSASSVRECQVTKNDKDANYSIVNQDDIVEQTHQSLNESTHDTSMNQLKSGENSSYLISDNNIKECQKIILINNANKEDLVAADSSVVNIEQEKNIADLLASDNENVLLSNKTHFQEPCQSEEDGNTFSSTKNPELAESGLNISQMIQSEWEQADKKENVIEDKETPVVDSIDIGTNSEPSIIQISDYNPSHMSCISNIGSQVCEQVSSEADKDEAIGIKEKYDNTINYTRVEEKLHFDLELMTSNESSDGVHVKSELYSADSAEMNSTSDTNNTGGNMHAESNKDSFNGDETDSFKLSESSDKVLENVNSSNSNLVQFDKSEKNQVHHASSDKISIRKKTQHSSPGADIIIAREEESQASSSDLIVENSQLSPSYAATLVEKEVNSSEAESSTVDTLELSNKKGELKEMTCDSSNEAKSPSVSEQISDNVRDWNKYKKSYSSLSELDDSSSIITITCCSDSDTEGGDSPSPSPSVSEDVSSCEKIAENKETSDSDTEGGDSPSPSPSVSEDVSSCEKIAENKETSDSDTEGGDSPSPSPSVSEDVSFCEKIAESKETSILQNVLEPQVTLKMSADDKAILDIGGKSHSSESKSSDKSVYLSDEVSLTVVKTDSLEIKGKEESVCEKKSTSEVTISPLFVQSQTVQEINCSDASVKVTKSSKTRLRKSVPRKHEELVVLKIPKAEPITPEYDESNISSREAAYTEAEEIQDHSSSAECRESPDDMERPESAVACISNSETNEREAGEPFLHKILLSYKSSLEKLEKLRITASQQEDVLKLVDELKQDFENNKRIVKRLNKQLSSSKRTKWCQTCYEKEAKYSCCRLGYYCSPVCQKLDWESHKRACCYGMPDYGEFSNAELMVPVVDMPDDESTSTAMWNTDSLDEYPSVSCQDGGSHAIDNTLQSPSYSEKKMVETIKKARSTKGTGISKRKRCGECAGCQILTNCGKCPPCSNPKTHQVCKQRRCLNLLGSPVNKSNQDLKGKPDGPMPNMCEVPKVAEISGNTTSHIESSLTSSSTVFSSVRSDVTLSSVVIDNCNMTVGKEYQNSETVNENYISSIVKTESDLNSSAVQGQGISKYPVILKQPQYNVHLRNLITMSQNVGYTTNLTNKLIVNLNQSSDPLLNLNTSAALSSAGDTSDDSKTFSTVPVTNHSDVVYINNPLVSSSTMLTENSTSTDNQ